MKLENENYIIVFCVIKYYGCSLCVYVDVAQDREVEGDLILADMGEGMPFQAGSFDGAISISALQWLCNADKTHHNPVKRLYKFFSTLYACLVRYFVIKICI